jgi:hypothetical protein
LESNESKVFVEIIQNKSLKNNIPFDCGVILFPWEYGSEGRWVVPGKGWRK